MFFLHNFLGIIWDKLKLNIKYGFLSNFSFGKTEDFQAEAFLDNYILYFPCIKNKYRLFVIQKISVLHKFIYS